MTLVITDMLAHGATAVWSDILQRGRLRGGGGNHDGVVHRPGFPELVDNLRYCGTLLANGDIDTNNVAAFLVDDRIDGNRGLAGLPIADDQFTLSTANRNHAVNSLESRLQRFFNRLTCDDTGRLDLDAPAILCVDGASAVDSLAQGIDDPSYQGLTYRDLGDPAGAFDRIALFNHIGFAEKRGSHVVFFEVQRDAENVVREFQQLAGCDFVQPVNTRNPVPGRKNRSDLLDLNRFLVVSDLFLYDAANLRCSDIHK